MPIDYPSDRGGTAGYVSPVKRKKNKNKKAVKSKADLRSGGMYSSGRAIPPAPGTKKSSTAPSTKAVPRRSADAYLSSTKKRSNTGARRSGSALGGLGSAFGSVARGLGNIQRKKK